MLRQARDSARTSDLQTLNQALTIYELNGAALGSSSVVYVSIPDTSATCGNLGLPSLPSGWTYACQTTALYRKVDGTGWVPVNFTAIPGGSPLASLPIDPSNTSSSANYYTYVTGGSWNLTALFESKNKHDAAINDGGSMPGVFELGTNLTLGPTTRDMGLVGNWRMGDSVSGSIANNATSGLTDSSGSGNNGTAGNVNGTGMAWATGKTGGAVSFDGVDDFVSAGNAESLNITNNITMSAWIYIESFPGTWASVVDKKPSDSGAGYALQVHASVLYYFYGGGYSSKSYNFNTSQWYYVAISYNVSTGVATYYVNANNIGTTFSGSPSISSNNLNIGRRPNGSYRFDGLIDDVRVYNRALSAAEIQAIYNGTQ